MANERGPMSKEMIDELIDKIAETDVAEAEARRAGRAGVPGMTEKLKEIADLRAQLMKIKQEYAPNRALKG